VSRPRRALVVAKAPRAGSSKTRLVPPLSSEAAADLAEAMLLDALDACRAEADAAGLLCPDAPQAEALAALAGPGVEVRVQRGRGLGAALREEMRLGVAGGSLAIVSSDVPGLPPGALARAFDRLDSGADLALGPALDGGYWAIAMARFHEEPFVGIPWSTPACLGVTLDRAAAAGLRAELVERWLDVDTVADLSIAVHAPPGPLGQRSATALARIGAEAEVPPPPSLSLASSELVLASPWRSLLRDRLECADGTRREYLYLAVPRAVFVVAVTPEAEVLLVRQYRHPVRDWTLEVPAGAVEDGEDPRAAAARELAEEAGARGGDWRHLGTFFSSSAHLSLRSDAYLATGVAVGPPRPDPGEEVVVVRVPVAEALRRARAGEMVEGQTALSLLLAAPHLE
jgi:rSAM/selenodomain-associated transferase 1